MCCDLCGIKLGIWRTGGQSERLEYRESAFIVETLFFLVSTESNIYYSFLCQETSRRTMY